MDPVEILTAEALAALTTEQLAEYGAQVRQATLTIADAIENDPAERTPERLDEARALSAQYRAVQALQAERVEADAAITDELASIRGEVEEPPPAEPETPAEPPAEPETPPVEPPAEPAPVEEPAEPAATPPTAIAASAAVPRSIRVPASQLSPPARQTTPSPASTPEAPVLVLTAAAGLRNYVPDQVFTDRLAVAEEAVAMHYDMPTATAQRVRYRIAKALTPGRGEGDRALIPGSPRENMEKINAAMREFREAGPQSPKRALVAAGGLCAPAEPRYQLFDPVTDERPLRDGLLRFDAARGAVIFTPPAKLADVTGGISGVTAAQDLAGATKSCQAFTCPTPVTITADAVYECFTFGNFQERFYGELVADWMAQADAAHARFAERRMLDTIAAGGTAVTTTQKLGAARDFYAAVDQATAALRNVDRVRRDLTFTVAVPYWLPMLLNQDVVRGQFQDVEDWDYAVTDVERSLANRGVTPIWLLDGRTGQDFAAQTAGALISFPSTMQWDIFADGTWAFIDGGEMAMGIYRDSVTNVTNTFQWFGETFENAAFFGQRSYHVTSTLCANGSAAPTAYLAGSPTTAMTCPLPNG